jgi:hypothetical protein
MLAPGEGLQRVARDAWRFSRAGDIVEIVVLTRDAAFLQTLREATAPPRRLWHVSASGHVGDLLLAGQVGMVVLDVEAIEGSAGAFLASIRQRFADLVMVLAGPSGAESALAAEIAAAAVHRFVHKPLSPGRAKMLADAVVRQYEAQRQAAALSRAGVGRARHARFIGLALGACALLVVGAWTAHRLAAGAHAAAPTQLRAAQPAGASLLGRASAALAADRLTEPRGENALELFAAALGRNPDDRTAKAGLEEVRERLYERADSALLQERIDDAAAAIEKARLAGIERGRIALLAVRLEKLRAQRAGPNQPE